MLKANRVLFAVITFSVTSCGTSKFRDIEEYSIEPAALNDGDSVNVLYWSNGPNAGDDQDFYYQYVVVKVNSTDTVRILSPSNNIIEEGDTGFEYISLDSKRDVARIAFIAIDDYKTLEDIKNVNDLKSAEFPAYKKVYSPGEFEYYENTKYPTVLGIVAQSTK